MALAGIGGYSLTRGSGRPARVPQREMGAIAARILISLLEHEPVRERHVRLEAELVVRRSTGVPRTVDRRVA